MKPRKKFNIVRMKLFIRFNEVSPTALAEEIEQRTGKAISRAVMHQVISGKMKTRWIREALADILNEPVETLWPDLNQPMKAA
jgi:hypothetical protein